MNLNHLLSVASEENFDIKWEFLLMSYPELFGVVWSCLVLSGDLTSPVLQALLSSRYITREFKLFSSFHPQFVNFAHNRSHNNNNKTAHFDDVTLPVATSHRKSTMLDAPVQAQLQRTT